MYSTTLAAMYGDEVFYAIKPSPGKRSVMDAYQSIDSLEGRVIIAREYTHIEVCGIKRFLARDAEMKEVDKRYHEVVLERAKQKLRFDFDAKCDDLIQIYPSELHDLNVKFCGLDADTPYPKTPAEKFAHIYNYVKARIIDQYVIYWGAVPRLVECEAVDPAGAKFSRHIIIADTYVSSSHQAKAFHDSVIATIPPALRCCLDNGVCKTLQNFRLPGHFKTLTDRRVKRIVTPGATLSDGMLTIVDGCAPLNNIVDEEVIKGSSQASVGEIDDVSVDNAIKIWEQSPLYDPEHRYRSCMKGFVNFDRIRPSECSICNREHANDNTLMLLIKRQGQMHTVYLCCRRRISSRKLIGDFELDMAGTGINCLSVAQNPDAPSGEFEETVVASKIRRALEDESLGLLSTGTLFDELPESDKIVYSEDKMRPYEHCRTLVIQAPMKLGKTRALREYISRQFPLDAPCAAVIRHVSFRLTFSNEIKATFLESTLYNEVEGPLDQNRLIVQVESLHRVKPDKVPDLLVLDEIESILEQFSAGLMKDADNSFKMFCWMVKWSTQVICMDANLSNRTYKFLSDMRPDFANGVSRVFHKNEFMNGTDYEYFLYDLKGVWMSGIINDLRAGQRVVVPTNSMATANGIRQMIEHSVPDAHICVYSSETEQAIKREHFRDVNTFWCDYDCIIYTPTITAGISFEEAHFDKVYAHFTNDSCSILSCIQMLGRVRNVLHKEMHILFEHRPCNVPTKTEDIFEWLFDRFSVMSFNKPPSIGQVFSSVSYDRDGRAHAVHVDEFLNLWVENMRVANVTKMDFIREFVRIVSKTGAKMRFMDEDAYRDLTDTAMYEDGKLREDLLEAKNELNLAMKDAKTSRAECIADARELTPHEASEIQTAMQDNVDVSRGDTLAYKKWWLRKTYTYDGVIDAKFVEKYDNENAKGVYRNLKTVAKCADTNTSVKQARETDDAEIEACNLANQPVRGHTRHYISPKVVAACEILSQCGWDGPFDVTMTTSNGIYAALSDPDGYLWRKMKPLSTEYGILGLSPTKLSRCAEKDYIDLALKFCNKILRKTFTISIKRSEEYFELSPLKIFTRDPDDKTMPYIGADAEASPVFTLDENGMV